MGSFLEIGVATYTDGVYYNTIFCERLLLGFQAAKNVLRLARAFAATRLVINSLKTFYNILPDSDSHGSAHLLLVQQFRAIPDLHAPTLTIW